jgi:hypothetical protein
MSLRFPGKDTGSRLKNIFAGVMELADVMDSKSATSITIAGAITLDLSRLLTTQYVNGF